MAKNPQNLKSLADRPIEERREIARKGAEASHKKKQERRTLRDTLQIWLESDSGAKDKDGNPLTGTDLMVAVAVKQMAKGNPRYWEIIRDTAGEKPVEKVMVAEVSQAVIDEVEKAVLDE